MECRISRAEILFSSFDQLLLVDNERLAWNRIRISFIGENGVDMGGLSREWYSLLVHDLFDMGKALFVSSENDQTVFHPNRDSSINENHLQYFSFIGKIIVFGHLVQVKGHECRRQL